MVVIVATVGMVGMVVTVATVGMGARLTGHGLSRHMRSMPPINLVRG